MASLSSSPPLPVFDVDLDVPPRRRWQAIAAAFAGPLQQLAEWQEATAAAALNLDGQRQRASGRNKRGGSKRGSGGRKFTKEQKAEQRIARFASAEAKQLLEKLSTEGPPAVREIVEELDGVAAAAGVGTHTLAMLSLQYEAYCACTAVIAPTEDGNVALARTLDWEFPELKALNIDVRVFRGKRLLYTATTWAGYIGMLTAQRPGHYALAVNFRERSDEDEELLDADKGQSGGSARATAGDVLPLPVGIAVRMALERCSGYAQFVEDVSTVPSMAPFYCMVASAGREGAQVTRCAGASGAELRRRELNVRQREEEEGRESGGGQQQRWQQQQHHQKEQLQRQYLVQANMDHWDHDPQHDTQESLERCALAEQMLGSVLEARGYATESELWALLSRHPIYDSEVTLYCTVMDPAAGAFRSLSVPPEAAEEGLLQPPAAAAATFQGGRQQPPRASIQKKKKR